MNEDQEQYIEGLARIRQARDTDRKNIKNIIKLFLFGAGIALVFPPAIIVEIAAIVLFWYSFFKTAGYPCPRCNKPFATNWSIFLGYHVNECHNCKLSFDLLAEHEGKLAKSNSKEWLK